MFAGVSSAKFSENYARERERRHSCFDSGLLSQYAIGTASPRYRLLCSFSYSRALVARLSRSFLSNQDCRCEPFPTLSNAPGRQLYFDFTRNGLRFLTDLMRPVDRTGYFPNFLRLRSHNSFPAWITARRATKNRCRRRRITPLDPRQARVGWYRRSEHRSYSPGDSCLCCIASNSFSSSWSDP